LISESDPNRKRGSLVCQDFEILLFVFQDVQKHEGFCRSEAQAVPFAAMNLQPAAADRDPVRSVDLSIAASFKSHHSLLK